MGLNMEINAAAIEGPCTAGSKVQMIEKQRQWSKRGLELYSVSNRRSGGKQLELGESGL